MRWSSGYAPSRRALRKRHIAMQSSLAPAFAAAIVVSFLAGVTVSPHAFAAEKAVAPERNPPGDIPDTQVFVTYTSPLGFAIKVPEGWSRKEDPQSVSFADKYNTIEVALASAAGAPTADSAKSADVRDLEKTGPAVKVTKVKDVKLKSGA